MSREAIRGNCRDTVAVLSELMEDALTPAAAVDTRAHLADCPRCRELLDSLRALPVAMRALIEDVASWLAPMAQARGVHLSVVGEPFSVNGDAEQLREALNNVIANAILYNKSGGSVTVS